MWDVIGIEWHEMGKDIVFASFVPGLSGTCQKRPKRQPIQEEKARTYG